MSQVLCSFLGCPAVVSLNRLADLVRGKALAGTVIGCDGEIVHSANS
jgi:hypothetical protein